MTTPTAPGGTIPQGRTAVTGPTGSNLPGSSMSVTKSAVVFLVVAVVGLGVFRWLLTEGERLAPMRVDVTEVVKIYLSYQVINVPMKLLAFHFHGHSFSQAILTFT